MKPFSTYPEDRARLLALSAQVEKTDPLDVADPAYELADLVKAILTDEAIAIDSGVANRRIFLDLDGVMADFDAHFPALFGVTHRGMLDDDMWAFINSHPSYFRDMPPCEGALEFFARIKVLDPIILTACPRSNYANTAIQKREWVREHLSPDLTVLPVMGGKNKPLFMHEPGDILIDDFERNTTAWSKHGGVAILHTDFKSTEAMLYNLGVSYGG
jgi:5'-nucleotidase